VRCVSRSGAERPEIQPRCRQTATPHWRVLRDAFRYPVQRRRLAAYPAGENSCGEMGFASNRHPPRPSPACHPVGGIRPGPRLKQQLASVGPAGTQRFSGKHCKPSTRGSMTSRRSTHIGLLRASRDPSDRLVAAWTSYPFAPPGFIPRNPGAQARVVFPDRGAVKTVFGGRCIQRGFPRVPPARRVRHFAPEQTPSLCALDAAACSCINPDDVQAEARCRSSLPPPHPGAGA